MRAAKFEICMHPRYLHMTSLAWFAAGPPKRRRAILAIIRRGRCALGATVSDEYFANPTSNFLISASIGAPECGEPH